MSRFELFCIVMSAVIGGGAMLAMSIAAVIRYSRHEERGSTAYKGATKDLWIAFFTGIVFFYGLWQADVFSRLH
jgi:hypothetical protein